LNIAKNIKSPEDITTLQKFNLNYQLAEAIILYGLLGDHMQYKSSPSAYWNRDHWEWHSDPGYDNKLSPNSRLSVGSIPTLPACIREITFSGIYLNKPAKELEAGVLYRGLSPYMAVGEFLTVDHATKTVYVFQVTLSNIKDHPFKATVIEKLMTGLKMINSDDDVSSQYTLHILCFADWSMASTHGVKIFDDRDATIKPFPCYNVKDWNAISGVKALKTSIIRSCLYPMDTKHELTDTTMPKIK